MARGRMMQALLKADVVITNPTHFAVALQYDTKTQSAPIVVAKGVDILAAKIREVATEHEIPIVPNPPLARALYKQCECGDIIPRDLFQPVAEILAYVYKTINKIR
jgi:flagellar biosynthetic protein FlhB